MAMRVWLTCSMWSPALLSLFIAVSRRHVKTVAGNALCDLAGVSSPPSSGASTMVGAHQARHRGCVVETRRNREALPWRDRACGGQVVIRWRKSRTTGGNMAMLWRSKKETAPPDVCRSCEMLSLVPPCIGVVKKAEGVQQQAILLQSQPLGPMYSEQGNTWRTTTPYFWGKPYILSGDPGAVYAKLLRLP